MPHKLSIEAETLRRTRVRTMARAGKTVDEIAEVLGMSRQGASQYMQSRGILTERMRLLQENRRARQATEGAGSAETVA